LEAPLNPQSVLSQKLHWLVCQKPAKRLSNGQAPSPNSRGSSSGDKRQAPKTGCYLNPNPEALVCAQSKAQKDLAGEQGQGRLEGQV